MTAILERFRAFRAGLTRNNNASKQPPLSPQTQFVMHAAQATISLDDRAKLAQQGWLDEMLPRLKEYSAQQSASVVVPSPAFHGSPYPGTKQFDETRGQGLGVWFQPDLVEAAFFAVCRSRYMETAQPVVYEAKLAPKNVAIFPTESDAYALFIPQAGDQKIHRGHTPFDLHQVRSELKRAGFDSIYLQDRQSISAINPSIIALVAEHRALPLFNAEVRPKLERSMGEDFSVHYAYLKNLTM